MMISVFCNDSVDRCDLDGLCDFREGIVVITMVSSTLNREESWSYVLQGPQRTNDSVVGGQVWWRLGRRRVGSVYEADSREAADNYWFGWVSEIKELRKLRLRKTARDINGEALYNRAISCLQ